MFKNKLKARTQNRLQAFFNDPETPEFIARMGERISNFGYQKRSPRGDRNEYEGLMQAMVQAKERFYKRSGCSLEDFKEAEDWLVAQRGHVSGTEEYRHAAYNYHVGLSFELAVRALRRINTDNGEADEQSIKHAMKVNIIALNKLEEVRLLTHQFESPACDFEQDKKDEQRIQEFMDIFRQVSSDLQIEKRLNKIAEDKAKAEEAQEKVRVAQYRKQEKDQARREKAAEAKRKAEEKLRDHRQGEQWADRREILKRRQKSSDDNTPER